jgi:long-chain acyl-CoA synthetase
MAPIRRDIGSFFALAQLPLCEAYGMVEAGVMAFRSAGSKEYASVGKPLRGVDFSIQEDGELVVTRAAPLTLRYFQCAEGENERTFLAPGRIATGDIGRFGKNGDLFVLGRKGETIVTAAGQKIHPEIVERELNNCPDIANSVIFQRPNTAHLSCVVTLNDPANDIARQRVQNFVNGLQSTRNISRFVEVIFADVPFSRENGMLRPNMKIDRRNVIARYRGAGSKSATSPRSKFGNPFGSREHGPKDISE